MVLNDTSRIERAILGGCLIDSGAIEIVLSTGVTAEAFSDNMCREVFLAMCELHADGVVTDLVTIHRPCADRGVRPSEIVSLTNEVASADNILSHCQELLRESKRRNILKLGSRIKNEEVTLEDIAQFVETNSSDNVSRTVPVSSVARESISEMFRRISDTANGVTSGTMSGIKTLDDITNGWQPSSLNVIAARPGMGKTAFAVTMARNISERGSSVLFFTLEMSRRSITDRLILNIAHHVSSYDYRRGTLRQEEQERAMVAADHLSQLPIHINDSPVVTCEYIRSISKSMKAQNKCDIVIIDYLQLIKATGYGNNGTREQEVARMTRSLKLLAKELECPVILLAQLSRAVESRNDKRPMLSDLRESGAIEQDADTVTFLYRPDYYDSDHIYTGEGVAIVAKNREGMTADAKFNFDIQMTKIY